MNIETDEEKITRLKAEIVKLKGGDTTPPFLPTAEVADKIKKLVRKIRRRLLQCAKDIPKEFSPAMKARVTALLKEKTYLLLAEMSADKK
jgi:hypothetical protein